MQHAQHGLYLGLHWTWWALWALIGVALVWALARTLGAAGRERPGDRARPRERRPETHEDQPTKETPR